MGPLTTLLCPSRTRKGDYDGEVSRARVGRFGGPWYHLSPALATTTSSKLCSVWSGVAQLSPAAARSFPEQRCSARGWEDLPHHRGTHRASCQEERPKEGGREGSLRPARPYDVPDDS